MLSPRPCGDVSNPSTGRFVSLAAELADRHPGISARDLVHVAVMQRLGINRIISADTDFDRLEGIDRLDPAAHRRMAGCHTYRRRRLRQRRSLEERKQRRTWPCT